jgi:aminoglycoside phosphotransferase family enzyme/predicted kinase
MITQDQSEVVMFLASPSTHIGAAVERIETHASIVFLAGTRAWKLKRAVRYDYLDFSTAERRRSMCEAELLLNRRTAPGLYRRVVAVTRESDGSLALGGQGTPIDWLVEMARFDQEGLLDRQAAQNALDAGLMPSLASAIARFHADAARRPDHGGRAAMAWVIDGNAMGFAEQGSDFLDAAACAALTKDTREALERYGPLLDARRDEGFVRQCHGDLHLRNIVMLDGRPTLFDGVEFNDDIACIDVQYDLSFLLMDLWRRQLPRHANAVWNGYLDETLDFNAVPLLPTFLSCRAAVRAKTSATAARLQTDPQRQRELQTTAREYLSLAQRLLHPPAPCLIGVGGFSGSGKSTLAHALAPLVGAAPGAVVIRSDVIRKRLYGIDPFERLGSDGYTTGTSLRVYGTVIDRASLIVRGGHAAIADAVFSRPSDREALEQAAKAAGVTFVGLWLDAPEATLIARSGARERDASDADAEVIRSQLAQDAGAITWHRLNASSAPEQVLKKAKVMLDANLRSEDRSMPLREPSSTT